jgi:hypothetical protein
VTFIWRDGAITIPADVALAPAVGGSITHQAGLRLQWPTGAAPDTDCAIWVAGEYRPRRSVTTADGNVVRLIQNPLRPFGLLEPDRWGSE